MKKTDDRGRLQDIFDAIKRIEFYLRGSAENKFADDLMRHTIANSLLLLAFAFCAVALVACSNSTVSLATEQQARDAAWAALDPNTTSHNRAYWEFTEVKQVKGEEVAGQFNDNPAPGCWAGPTPPANTTIAASDSYWFVRAERRAMTVVPQKRTVSPTEPPAIPDAFMYKALFLVDSNGKVVARQLYCVIY
jgi:hypothetical protein